MSEGVQREAYSHFTNEYVLTQEICAEAERSRIDVGLLCVVVTLTGVLCLYLLSLPEVLYALERRTGDAVLLPSDGTVLQMSGVNAQVISGPVIYVIALVMLVKFFPKIVGEKRLKEQLTLVPSVNRRIDFYEKHVRVEGKLSRSLPYSELKRTGETRNLYILYFRDKRILILHKAGFRKGRLQDVKEFIRKRRTLRSRLYGVIHYVPTAIYILLFAFAIWEDLNSL